MLLVFSLANEDPDVENARVVPDMGTIELRTYRCRAVGTAQYNPDYKLHQGRVSERSKKAGWHHVGYVLGFSMPPVAILIHV
jgi:hypothetical protein